MIPPKIAFARSSTGQAAGLFSDTVFFSRPPAQRHRPLLAAVLLLASLTGTLTQAAFADAVTDKADAFLRQGDVSAATSIYQAQLRQNPGNLHAQLAMAEMAQRRYNYPQTQKMLEQILAQHPESGEVNARLGRLYQLWMNSASGKPSDNSRNYKALAGEYFMQARKLEPNNPAVLSLLGEWEIQQNDLSGANRDFSKALSLNPNNVTALQGQARMYMKMHDIARGRDAGLHALDIDSQNSATYFLVAQLLGMAGQPAQAVKSAKQSEALDFGTMPERDYFLAEQYEKLGELDAATHYYETLTGYTPRESQIWYKLGDLYEQQHQGRKSMDAYQRAITLDPTLLQKLIVKARNSARLEQVENAQVQWHRVLNLQNAMRMDTTETWGSIASLYYAARFLNPTMVPGRASEDLNILQHSFPTSRPFLGSATGSDPGLPGFNSVESPSSSARRGRRNPSPGMTPQTGFMPGGAQSGLSYNVNGGTPRSTADTANDSTDAMTMNRIKITLAITPTLTSDLQNTLIQLSRQASPAIAGEAAFFLDDHKGMNAQFDEVDGLSPQAYTQLADRLFLDQEFQFAQVFYQRAYELQKDPNIPIAIQRIQAKQALAQQRISAGNDLFNAKKYDEALAMYLQALKINHESDTAYLRLADTYERLKKNGDAKIAYDHAIALTPTLLDSEGFSKHYAKLKKEAEKLKEKENKKSRNQRLPGRTQGF